MIGPDDISAINWRKQNEGREKRGRGEAFDAPQYPDALWPVQADFVYLYVKYVNCERKLAV